MKEKLSGKTIKLAYTDLWDDFDMQKDFIYKILIGNGAKIEISDQPDYLIFGPCGYNHLGYDCIKVFYTGEAISPDFNLCDYALAFDDISFGDRYMRMPLYLHPIYEDDLDMALKKHLNKQVEEKISEIEEFCSFIVSNDKADPFRTEFYKELSKYKVVNSGGKYLNNIGCPVIDKYAFNRKHKFSVAFENVSHKGYVTEKILQAFAAGCIPIYWGNSEVAKEFNEKAFVNVMNYASIDEAISIIKEIDSNDELYRQMLREPIFKDNNFVKKKKLEVEEFVLNIFMQSYEEAKRNTRLFWNKIYIDRLREMKRKYEIPEKRGLGIKTKIKRIFEQK